MREYGWLNFLSEAEWLKRASELVSKGELHNAITLLEQALVTRSRSEKIHEVLAELQARLGQPQKIGEQKKVMMENSISNTSDGDLADETDFAYLEEQSSQLEEREYHFDQPVIQQKASLKPTLRLKTCSHNKTEETVDKVGVKHKQRETLTPSSAHEEHTEADNSASDTDQASSTLRAAPHGGKNIWKRKSPLKSPHQPKSVNNNREVNTLYEPRSEKGTLGENFVCNRQVSLTTPSHVDPPPETTPVLPKRHGTVPPDSTHSPEIKEVFEFKTMSSTASLPSQAIENEDLERKEDEFESFNDYVDEREWQDDDTPGLGLQQIDIDNGPDESFSFDDSEADLYDFWDDEIDESEDNTRSTVVLDNRITREERAQLVAVECIQEFDWHTKQLPFLIEIFSKLGWSGTRKALESEVNGGATFDELELAFAVKGLWQDSSRYWTTLSKAWAEGESADAIYRHCSWKQALRLVRLFEQLPTLDEVYDFLEREFEHWYHNRILRLCFPAFIKYLFLYRLNSRNEISMFNGFELAEEHDGFEAEWLSQSHSNPMEKLKALGIDLVDKYAPKSYYASDLYTHEYILELYRLSGKTDKGGTE